MIGVDATGVGGDHIQSAKRFPTAMRLNKQMIAIAAARGFEPNAVSDMFDLNRLWNLATRSYSVDGMELWKNWIDVQVTIHNENHYTAGGRAWQRERGHNGADHRVIEIMGRHPNATSALVIH